MAWELPGDEVIADILIQRIEAQNDGVGIVAGVIDGEGRRVVARGKLAKGDGRRLDGDTVFDIGSITKVFTSLLLADMVERGEVALEDSAARFLPAGVAMPGRNGRQITLIDLATHTSGLPPMPDNLTPSPTQGPFVGYDSARLYAYLNGHTLQRDVGEAHVYSNLGVGLLGHLLALRAGVGFGALIRERVAAPLGLESTSLETTPRMAARLAHGHDRNLSPVPNWTGDVLAGMGLLRSTTNDLLRLLAAELGFVETSLKAAMAAQLRPRRPMGSGDGAVGLGWYISRRGGPEIYWHNGRIGGYRTFAGLDFESKRGVVVLTNVASERGGDDIGFHLLTGAPLKPAPPLRCAIELPAVALARFVGRYQLDAAMIITVTLEDGKLLAQATGQPLAQIFPEAETAFFWKVVNAQATFELDGDGQVTALVLHQGGRDRRAPRVPEA